MQGLAFAQSKPLIGVSALDALATIASRTLEKTTRPVATWIDAWRGEVYAALYDGVREIEPVAVESPERVLARLTEGAYFIGDGVALHRALIEQRLGDRGRIAPVMTPPLAGTIAQLAHAAAQAGERPSADAIRPLYVRRPDAEIARDAHAPR